MLDPKDKKMYQIEGIRFDETVKEKLELLFQIEPSAAKQVITESLITIASSKSNDLMFLDKEVFVHLGNLYKFYEALAEMRKTES